VRFAKIPRRKSVSDLAMLWAVAVAFSCTISLRGTLRRAKRLRIDPSRYNKQANPPGFDKAHAASLYD
jgi:hypothetical protein